MYSSTDENIESFMPLGDTIDVPDYWSLQVRMIPANAKYVMIKYTTRNRYYTCIDDISIEVITEIPEVELTYLRVPYMVGNNQQFSIRASLLNNSSVPIESFTVSYTIDGNAVTDNITDVNVEYNETYDFTIPTQAIISDLGSHTISVTIQNPNGITDDISDNTMEASVIVYNPDGTVHRKLLMEHFSSASCPSCYSGHVNVENALAQGYDEDIIWVIHHTGSYTDRFTLPEDETFKGFFNDNGSAYSPAVMLDRTYFGEFEFTHAIGVPTGPVFYPYTDLDVGFETALSIPAYVTVGFDALEYDSNSRQLSVTVSGEVLSALNSEDPRLNVWLMEDGLLGDGGTEPGHGPVQAYAPEGFCHDHVVRVLLSPSAWGDADVVSSEAGSTYSKVYTCTLPEQYVDSKCYVIAFVSEGNHSNYNNCKVYNAEKSPRLTDGLPTDIDGEFVDIQVYPNPAHAVVQISGLDGRNHSYSVYSVTGQCVRSGKTTGQINVASLSEGSYILELKVQNSIIRKKFLVE